MQIEDEIKFIKTIKVSKDAKDFVEICLKKDPRDRFTAPELLEHPFMLNIESTTLEELF
jgi:serine/threonine protein kinase